MGTELEKNICNRGLFLEISIVNLLINSKKYINDIANTQSHVLLAHPFPIDALIGFSKRLGTAYQMSLYKSSVEYYQSPESIIYQKDLNPFVVKIFEKM